MKLANAVRQVRDFRRYQCIHVFGRQGPPAQEPAREFFNEAIRKQTRLYTSAEVLQELPYCYIPVNRMATLEAAMSLISRAGVKVWPLESENVFLACRLHEQFPMLGVRDLCHLASCQRRGVGRIKTFDQTCAAVSDE